MYETGNTSKPDEKSRSFSSLTTLSKLFDLFSFPKKLMLFVFAFFIGSLALPIAGFQDLLPSMLRSSDGNVAHYSRQVGKYAKRIEDAHDKEVKLLNAGKQLEASGKLTLHSLKNPQTRSELHAIGLIENTAIEKRPLIQSNIWKD